MSGKCVICNIETTGTINDYDGKGTGSSPMCDNEKACWRRWDNRRRPSRIIVEKPDRKRGNFINAENFT